MSKDTTLLWLLPGLTFFVMSRLLLRAEAAHGRARVDLPSPFGDAVAAMAGWFAFGGMLLATFYQLGLPALLAVAVLGLGAARLLPAGPELVPYLKLKLPLALAAVLVAVSLLFGVIVLFEGVFYG